jgi:uncharacterized membrane protein (UPF0127 family)
VRDGDVLAAAETADSRIARVRGLLGRTDLEGAFLIPACRHVHTIGMRFPIDVAFVDGDGVVLKTCELSPWRVSPLVWGSRLVIEAHAGAFERWGLAVGDRVEVR